MPPSANPAASAVPAAQLVSATRLYGSFVALREVSLTLPAGSCTLLLGANGAGKSTLLKLLAGLARPSYGQVSAYGGAPEAQHGRIGYMGHQSMLYDELSGTENLQYFLQLEQPSKTAEERQASAIAALREVGLDPALQRRVGDYSQGMRQRASLARVLLAGPDLLLLDEPFSNLDARSADAMVERLKQWLAEPGATGLPHTLVLTTHQPRLAERLATQQLWMANGRLLPPDPASTASGLSESAASPNAGTLPPEFASQGAAT